MSHLPSNMSDLVRDLITLRGNGSLDLNTVLSDVLVFRKVKTIANCSELFQNNISAFPKVTNYTHCLSQAGLLLQLKFVTFGKTKILF